MKNIMKNKIIIFVLLIGIIAAVGIFFIETRKNEDDFETRRGEIICKLQEGACPIFKN